VPIVNLILLEDGRTDPADGGEGRNQSDGGAHPRVLAGLVYALVIPYYQSHLNKVWDQAVAGGAPQLEPADQHPEIPPPPSTV
jgi:hypothetical protein